MTETMLVGCPRCNAINRVPKPRLPESPTCGKCTASLFDGYPLALDAAGFHAHAERADLPLLVDFWAPWCGPCQAMAPEFEAAAAQLEPRLRLAKVDTEAHPALGGRFGIRSIPTLLLFRQGRELARQPGAMGTADIVRWALHHLPH